MNICDTFQYLARQTWNGLEIGRGLRHQLLEETLTDVNLLHLKYHHPEVQTYSFTKHAEGKNGADWEWWFYDFSGRFIGLRVQAKVLDFRTRSFNQLYYHKDKSSLSQCDKLILKAKSDPLHPLLPFYILYLEDPYLPDLINHPSISDRRIFGCSVVSAYHIRNLKPIISNSLADWQSKLVPWSTLVCDSRKRGFMDTQSMLEDIQERFAFPQAASYLQSPPEYVRQLIESDGQLDNIKSLPDLAGLVTVRLTGAE